jgi:predicted heme/steroid binding protein
MPLWVRWWKPLTAAVVALAAALPFRSSHRSPNLWQASRSRLDRYLMGVFRDLGRYKARKRRHANDNSLMETVLWKRGDDPEADLALANDHDHDISTTYTLGELWEFGNGIDDNPILIAVLGRVYDVSAGERFYGETGPYHVFAGRDVTYALGAGCFRDLSCVDGTLDSNDLSDRERLESQRWLSFFHLHDKYPLVGKLEGDTLQAILDDIENQETEDNRHTGPGCPNGVVEQ